MSTEIESPVVPPPDYASYKVLILSNVFFVVASACYTVGGVMDYKENQKAETDQGHTGSWTILMVGAICFIIVGGLDYWNTRLGIQIIMIFAGIFGVASAATSESKTKASLACNMVSVHLFLLESLKWIYTSKVRKNMMDKNDSRRQSFFLAESGAIFFFVGAVIDVGLSYVYLLEHQKTTVPETVIATQSVATSRAAVASAVFWLVASLFTIVLSCRVGRQGFAGATDGRQSKLSANASGSMA